MGRFWPGFLLDYVSSCQGEYTSSYHTTYLLMNQRLKESAKPHLRHLIFFPPREGGLWRPMFQQRLESVWSCCWDLQTGALIKDCHWATKHWELSWLGLVRALSVQIIWWVKVGKFSFKSWTLCVQICLFYMDNIIYWNTNEFVEWRNVK